MKKAIKKILLGASARLYRIAILLENEDRKEDGELLRYPECLFSNSRADTLKNLSDRLEDYIESGLQF